MRSGRSTKDMEIKKSDPMTYMKQYTIRSEEVDEGEGAPAARGSPRVRRLNRVAIS